PVGSGSGTERQAGHDHRPDRHQHEPLGVLLERPHRPSGHGQGASVHGTLRPKQHFVGEPPASRLLALPRPSDRRAHHLASRSGAHRQRVRQARSQHLQVGDDGRRQQHPRRRPLQAHDERAAQRLAHLLDGCRWANDVLPRQRL
ncbi:PAZ/Piwi domain protein, partial [Aphelenchoides avenae]